MSFAPADTASGSEGKVIRELKKMEGKAKPEKLNGGVVCKARPIGEARRAATLPAAFSH